MTWWRKEASKEQREEGRRVVGFSHHKSHVLGKTKTHQSWNTHSTSLPNLSNGAEKTHCETCSQYPQPTNRSAGTEDEEMWESFVFPAVNSVATLWGDFTSCTLIVWKSAHSPECWRCSGAESPKNQTAVMIRRRHHEKTYLLTRPLSQTVQLQGRNMLVKHLHTEHSEREKGLRRPQPCCYYSGGFDLKTHLQELIFKRQNSSTSGYNRIIVTMATDCNYKAIKDKRNRQTHFCKYEGRPQISLEKKVCEHKSLDAP